MDNSSTQKKRDCTVAVPLYEALELPNIWTSNIEAHADMYAHTRASIARAIIKDTYPEDIKMLQCVGCFMNFPGS